MWAALGVMLLAGAGWGAVSIFAPAAEAQYAEDRQGDADAIEAARTEVTASRPKADNITFGKVFVQWAGNEPAVCGSVDIEEQQDSLTGSERFVYFEGDLLVESEDGSAALTERWNDLCKTV